MTAHVLRVAVAVTLVWIALSGVDFSKRGGGALVDPPDSVTLGKLAAVSEVLRNASAVDRALWAEVWEKSAKVVDGDSVDPIFTDTASLRAFTTICLDMAWNRIAGNRPGKYRGLREAVETFLADPVVMGREDVPMSEEVRQKWCKAARALAYAGANRG